MKVRSWRFVIVLLVAVFVVVVALGGIGYYFIQTFSPRITRIEIRVIRGGLLTSSQLSRPDSTRRLRLPRRL